MTDNMSDNKLVDVNNLKKHFSTNKGPLHAVDGVDFHIFDGETLGLVGESGCGKSTTGRLLIRLIENTDGEVLFKGENIFNFGKDEMKAFRRSAQIVFQDPYSSLDPRMSVSDIISEPLQVHKIFNNASERSKKVEELMEVAGLAKRTVNSYPHELDGGSRQRVGIARALSLNPDFLVLDEPVSALDVSIQAQIINLFDDLQQEYKLTYLFIAHDLSVVKHVSDRIAVMYMGEIVELADYDKIIFEPMHPYTQALVAAIPKMDIEAESEKIILEGDVPSPVNPVKHCRFYGRCRERMDICKEKEVSLQEVEPGRFVSCLLHQ